MQEGRKEEVEEIEKTLVVIAIGKEGEKGIVHCDLMMFL